ncbi:Anti-silencing protein [Entamoeba marina]
MASLLKITTLHNNPGKMNEPYSFEIILDVREQLQEDIDIKVTYVGSSFDDEKDQILEDIAVGPLNTGMNKFSITTSPVDFQKLPDDEILGNTLILLGCFYKNKEFCRVGYFVNNEYEGIDPSIDVVTRQMLDYTKITRTLSEPRITVFPCLWDAEEAPLQTKMEGDTNEQEILLGDEEIPMEELSMDIKEQIRDALGVAEIMKQKEQQESFAEEKTLMEEEN